MRLHPGIDGALIDREGSVGDHQIHVVVDGVAEALAALAGSIGTVEAEQAGFGGDELAAALAAGELFGEFQWLAAGGWVSARGRFKDGFAGFAVTGFERIDDALMETFADHDAVGQDVDRLGEIDLEDRFGGGEFVDFAVLIEPGEA